jgi:glycyl-tRNA synthetase beta chain
LRRAALGVIKIVLERKLPLSLSAAIESSVKAYAAHASRLEVTAEAKKQILEFVLDRARFVMRERMHFAYDEVNAVLAAGADELVDAVRRLEALKAIRKTKNFEPLAVSFKRIRKILEKAGSAAEWRQAAVNPERFEHAAERSLHEESKAAAKIAAAHKRAGNYREALQAVAALRPAVDRFFDEVLVMAEDESRRRNRLTLLAELLGEFSTIADFSELAAGEKGLQHS